MLLLFWNFMGCILIVCAECLCDGIRSKCQMLYVNRDTVTSPASHCNIPDSSYALGYNRNKKLSIVQITQSSSSLQVKGIAHALEMGANSKGIVESFRLSKLSASRSASWASSEVANLSSVAKTKKAKERAQKKNYNCSKREAPQSTRTTTDSV